MALTKDLIEQQGNITQGEPFTGVGFAKNKKESSLPKSLLKWITAW